MTFEESHTGPSIITFFLFAANDAVGHVPNTLLDQFPNHQGACFSC